MAAFTAAVELLGLIGESSELAKLGSQARIFSSIQESLNELLATGITLDRATEIVRNRYTSNAPNEARAADLGRGNAVEIDNQDFIQRINRNVRENTLRQRRPIYEEKESSENDPLLQTVPLDNPVRPVRLPRPIRPGISNILKKGVAAATGAAAIGQIINTPSDNNPTPNPDTNIPNTNTPIPDTSGVPLPGPTETIKILHPALDGIPNNVSNNILNSIGNFNNDDLVYNLHLKGGYKFPPYHWHEDSAQNYMYQSLYNTFAGVGGLD